MFVAVVIETASVSGMLRLASAQVCLCCRCPVAYCAAAATCLSVTRHCARCSCDAGILNFRYHSWAGCSKWHSCGFSAFDNEGRNVTLYLLSISRPCLFLSSPQSVFPLRDRTSRLANGLGGGGGGWSKDFIHLPDEGRFHADERRHFAEPH